MDAASQVHQFFRMIRTGEVALVRVSVLRFGRRNRAQAQNLGVSAMKMRDRSCLHTNNMHESVHLEPNK